MAVCFWYLVKSYSSCVRVYTGQVSFFQVPEKKHGHVYLVGLYLYIFLYPVQRGNLPGNTSHYPNILYTPSVLQTYQQLGKYVKKKKYQYPQSYRDVKGEGSFHGKFAPFAKSYFTDNDISAILRENKYSQPTEIDPLRYNGKIELNMFNKCHIKRELVEKY